MVRINGRKVANNSGIEVIVTPDSRFFYVMLTIENPRKLEVECRDFRLKFRMMKDLGQDKLVLSKRVECKDSMIAKGHFINFDKPGSYDCSLFLKPDFLFPLDDVERYENSQYKRILKPKTDRRMNRTKNDRYTNYSHNNASNPYKGGTCSHN